MVVTQLLRHKNSQPAADYPTVVLDGTPPVPPSPPAPAMPRIPGYEIIRLIDRGGMSNIYLAKQKGLERLVAVKMIRPQDSLDSQLRKRFMCEASSIASLQHPHVVQIHEIGEADDGMPYLCLEYIAGGNLERKLRERLPSARESAEIVRQLAEAIQAAHDRQIIHRDLKPANVLYDIVPIGGPVDDSGNKPSLPAVNVKLTDFGLARILYETSDQTTAGFTIGTPSFMSPEQASGHLEDIGKSTDIYGLGAILYELLTGDPPFLGETASETMCKVRAEPPVPPRQLNSRVPFDLEQICLRCLEKEPANRYASAGVLAADLRRFLIGRSVAAQPPGPIRKWWGRCFNSLSLLTIAILTIGRAESVATHEGWQRSDPDAMRNRARPGKSAYGVRARGWASWR